VFGWFLHGRLRFVLAGFRRARNRFFHVRGLVFGVRTVIVSGFGGGQRRGGQRPAASTIREVSLVRCFMVMSFSLEAKGSGILGLRLFNGC